MGYIVETPTLDLLAWADYVVIANFNNRKEIKGLLKENIEDEKIVELYDEDADIPFYMEKIQMEAESTWNICPPSEYGTVDKYSLWKAEGSGENYEKDVERNFFDAVTKQYYLNYIRPGDRVLDIGAGTGRLSVEIAKYGAVVTAVDTSADMMKFIKKKNSSIETVVVTDEKLPFERNSFDKVVSCDAMVHFLNWKDFLREHTRVVKRGGYIIYNLCNDENLRNISEIKSVRASYISDWSGRGYCAPVSHDELISACKEIGLKLIQQLPYRVLSNNGLSYGILSRGEMHSLGKFYFDLCKNEKMRELISRFEKEIVSEQSADISAYNICVFEKL